MLAPGRCAWLSVLGLRQLELDDGYGFLNRFELLADAVDDFLFIHRPFVPSSRPLVILPVCSAS